MKLPWILAVLRVGGFVGLAILLSGCKPKAPAAPQKLVVRYVEAVAADASPVQSRSEYIGVIRGDVETDLSFKVGGVIESIGRSGQSTNWQEGVRISAGEVLAQLKQEDFLSAAKSARAQAALATKEFERYSQLRKDNVLSQQELDASSTRKQSADAELSRVEQALLDSVIRAPYDGTVLSRLANPGENVTAGKVVLKVADLREMAVELGVPDRLVGRIKVGREIPVKVSSQEAVQFVGRVSEVGARAREGARLFRVILKVENPNGALKSGMTASVVLDEPTAFAPGAVMVPLSALVGSSKGGAANALSVFVVDASGIARERPVKTDDIVRSSIVVTEGLKPGERVVTVGASTLFDGAAVDARAAENL